MHITLDIFQELDLISQGILCLRIFLAAICGCLIGNERSRRSKGAGIRTHMIIAMSAALMTIVSKYGFFDIMAVGMDADASRIASNIVTGIPFLGAGVILVRQKKSSVQGLTTAAGMWATCGIGMALGGGLYILGAFSTILLIILQFLMHRILTGHDSSFIGEAIITAALDFDAEDALCSAFADYKLSVQKSQVKRHDNGFFTYRIAFKTNREIPSGVLASTMAQIPEFVSIEI